MRVYSKKFPRYKSMQLMELIQELQSLYVKIGRAYTYLRARSDWDPETEDAMDELIEQAWKLENELEGITDLEYEDYDD